MKYYVYIIESLIDRTFYKGFTSDYDKRLEYHNSGKSRFTSTKMPWKLVYVEECEDKTTALKREKSLKKSNQKYLSWLIDQSQNLLNGR